MTRIARFDPEHNDHSTRVTASTVASTAAAAAVATHEADATAAHPASAISVSDGGPRHWPLLALSSQGSGGYFAGTDVEAVLAEIGAALAAGVTNLNSLSDVTITSPADLQRLHYVAASGQWVNTSAIWRPLMDGAGAVITDGGTGEAIMALS